MVAAQERDLKVLRALPYQTPPLRQFFAEGVDLDDPFEQHLLDLAVPPALAYNRIMVAYNGNPSGVEFKHHERDSWAFVLPDAAESGHSRIQYFDRNGFISHRSIDTLEMAVVDMVVERYTVDAPGTLDRLAATTQWRRGMAVAYLIQELGAGLITHQEFIRRQALLGPAQPA